MKREILLILTFCFVMLFASSAISQNVNEPILIGVIQPLSGPLAVSGYDSLVGTQIAIDLINERGGINGRQIKLIVADVPDQDAAKNEVNRLIFREKVDVVTGVYGSAFAEVAANICDRNEVLYWENISITDKLTKQGYKTVFRVHINGTGFGIQAAQMAEAFSNKIGVSPENLKIAVISENGAFGQSVTNGVLQYSKEAGMNIVLNELYDSKTLDTSPIVLRMKAVDPDVAIVTSYINDGINMTKNMKTYDYIPKLFLGIGSGYGLSAYYDTLKKDAEGIIDIDPSTSPKYENLDPEMREVIKEFEKRYTEIRGYTPPAVGYLCFQAAWVLAYDVIQAAGGTNIEAMVKAAQSIDIPVGKLPTGAGVKFDETGQNQRALLAMMQWQDGRLVTIYPESIAEAEPIMIPHPKWSERK